jgi:uncharacterized repeat protein (TIGR03803 family)
MTPTGVLSAFYSFCSQPGGSFPNGCVDGSSPVGGVIQATDGNLYGTTSGYGGEGAPPLSYGNVFQLTLGGTLTTLHSFSLVDGAEPQATVFQATDGNLYGTSFSTIYKIQLGAQPFVALNPSRGGVGAKVIVLGTNLTGATAVTFNGKPALFTIVSPSEITVKVPKGAETGAVKVVTATGTFTSNVVFTVT